MKGILARHGLAFRGAWAEMQGLLAAWLATLMVWGTVATAGAAEPVALPPDGSFLRVTVDGGISPFTSVVWDVTVRGEAVVVSLVKESLCRTGQRERVRLLQGDPARTLLESLVGAGVWTVGEVPRGATAGRARDASGRPGEVRYEVWMAWGRQMSRWTVTQGQLHRVPQALRVVTVLPDLVRTLVDPLPMRDLYVPAGRIGYLTVTASEEGEMVIDGWDRVPLPVESLEVVEGDHQVVATSRSGKVQRFRVQVLGGGMHRVHVLFQAPEGEPAP
ncbi:MAG TPA: hypothetical protein PLQ97_05170 [Myxococcota bacterium]|nr:hypothetical protein [Myxococcota bacterium]HQK51637.1 hypothetical protein [Myxococcota bacterium]